MKIKLKQMKNTIQILGLSLLITGSMITTTLAQQGPPKELTQEQLMKHIEKDHVKLQLSEDQKEPFTEVALKYAGQMKTLKKKEGSRESKREEAESIMKNKNEEMKGILSESQYQAYLVMQEDRKKMMKRRGERRR